MRAITLWPEWAALIAHGLKSCENRSWKLPEGERIAIHAGAHIGGRKGRVALAEATDVVWSTARAAGVEGVDIEGQNLVWWPEDATDARREPIVTSAIVCTAVVGKPHRSTGAPWENDGPTTWVNPLLDVVRLQTPVSCRGAQGLWVWTQ